MKCKYCQGKGIVPAIISHSYANGTTVESADCPKCNGIGYLCDKCGRILESLDQIYCKRCKKKG